LPALSHRSVSARRGDARRLGPSRILDFPRCRGGGMVRASARRRGDGLPGSADQLRRREPAADRIQRGRLASRANYLQAEAPLRLRARHLSDLPALISRRIGWSTTIARPLVIALTK